MHRRPAARAAVLLSVLCGIVLVAGCTLDTTTAPATIAATDAEAATLPTVTGARGSAPTLTFPDSAPPDHLVAEVLVEGHGPTVRANDLVVADYVGQVWGGAVFDSSYTRGAVLASQLSSLVPGWADGLTGTTVGSRVLLSVPPSEGYGSKGNADVGITGKDTIVFVVDIRGSFGATASGEATATPTAPAPDGVVVAGKVGFPATVRVLSGTPAPLVASRTVLATGSGAPLRPGHALVQTAATDWAGADPGSTWHDSGPIQVSLASGQPFAVLVGVPVGSRVVVLFPATPDVPPVAAVVDVLAQT